MSKTTTTLTERIVARSTEAEKQAVKDAAINSKRTTSDYVRLILAEAVKEKKIV